MATKTKKQNNKTKYVTLDLLSDATDTVLKGMQSMFDGQKKVLDDKFDKLDTKIDYVHNDLQKQINDLKIDSPSRIDFVEVKKKVDFYHPAS